jgi:hypothetical protein
MTPRNDPRIFCGPPLPLDDRTGSQPVVVFAAEEQPRDTQGRYRAAQGSYRGEDMTPKYRQQLLNHSPIGRQILKAEAVAAGAPATASAGGTGSKAVTNDYKQQSLVYAQLGRQIFKDEAAAGVQARR